MTELDRTCFVENLDYIRPESYSDRVHNFLNYTFLRRLIFCTPVKSKSYLDCTKADRSNQCSICLTPIKKYRITAFCALKRCSGTLWIQAFPYPFTDLNSRDKLIERWKFRKLCRDCYEDIQSICLVYDQYFHQNPNQHKWVKLPPVFQGEYEQFLPTVLNKYLCKPLIQMILDYANVSVICNNK